MSDRAVAPVIGVVLLVALTVVTAAVGAVVAVDIPGETTAVTFGLEAASDGEIRLLHRGGDAVEAT